MSPQPAILYGQINFPANSVGRYTLVEGIWNRNPFPVVVSKLAFSSGTGSTPVVGLTRVRLEYASEPITNGDVPISSFCYPDSPQSAEYALNRYQIRLAKPIYLGPGERISVEMLRHTGTLAPTTAATYTITAIGSRALTRPPKLYLPYFAAFVGATRRQNSGAFTETSTEANLGNPFHASMLVDRFVGRVYFNGTGFVWTEAFASLPICDYLSNQVKIRIEDHRGNFLVREPVPHGAVFDFPTRSWPVKTMLDARGFYRVTHEGTLATIQAVDHGTESATVITGMVGYREIGQR